ncbi:MAG: 1-deoxy-D-xylulose-5-phosphate synthase [Candidatus Moranbacteria bacterium GW2011_GWF2_34_56]|nr:MAG: 1-deoxy-D-xylulose-5-phosphate synthase [Candidatus Moranbacteria bacterium GW2011_GWF1_34_10]KKP64792.1 MAG: 1-deoxy-D-xylulose-5-phosphate synthase [Candidatus Moranbacteria bacterium GW2011_GWF2_34_56]HBI16858.1 1-deoxy-D-xylulose-5-phosphate synthase [Candidatus Moranbacteria bacterium]
MKKKRAKRILEKVYLPKDLKKLSEKELVLLCEDVRNFLIESVAKTGGHFGSNLGVVELTVALHKVFNTPKDSLIWDVGHQSYPHKILTGRKDKLHTIRKKGGLAPFPKREESKYDAFGVGHSSTSISIATGLAIGNKSQKKSRQAVAIIGDGALSGGMAMEALNHAGDARANILVILNDNKMSISPNVGGMSKYLTRLISSPSYTKFRKKGREFLGVIPSLQEFVRKAELYARGMITPGTFFEELGFAYYGPIDGHDVLNLVEVLENLKKIKGPRFLHIITTKGKGYAPAEKDCFSLHAVKPFNLVTGEKIPDNKSKLTFSKVFSDWICDKAQQDKNLHAVTPAMCDGSGLGEFSKKFNSRYHDVGIAEQHAVTFAAGLACAGQKPVVAIYSSFLQRAYDQVIHDVALQNLDVLFAVDRAGIVGADGATHNGSFDLSFSRLIPNLVIMAPSDEEECYNMLEFGYNYSGPVVVRYPRGGVSASYDKKKNKEIKYGKARVVKSGSKIAILSFGTMLGRCENIAEELNATLVDMRFIKPLDEELLKELSKNHKYFITIEDNAIKGGAGGAVNEFFMNNKIEVFVKNLGLPDKFLEHGSRDEVLSDAELSEEGIRKSIEEFVKK